MFSNEERCILGNNQLAEVICQLRFPEILMINEKAPAEFQEAIRKDFPQYSSRKETPMPKIIGVPGNFSLDNQKATMNYQFVSADGVWRVNLTSSFISLACNRYTCWEDFAKHLDKPLASFIQIYQPAFFTRVGLRYLNFISRKNLSLEGTPFSELFHSQYLGLLADGDVPEHTAARNSIDAELSIPGGCRIKIHAGPGMVKIKGTQDNEVRFIFDQDLFMNGNIPVNLSAGALETLHNQAYSVFRGAITDTLYEAMDPKEL
ncbi:MAG: TIGR04255 family protein [Oscillospiraceae bacterium]|nr:TIGR04255 family protein [Oscillospiraceae bacterium]